MSLGKDDLKREMKPVKVIGPAALGTLYGILQGIEAAGEIVLPAPEPVVTPAANAQPERLIAPFVRTLYALLEGPYDETLCEWSENGRRIVFPDPTEFAETVCPQCFRHSKWTSFSRMLSMYDFRKVSSTPRSGAAPARAGLAPMVFEHDSFRRGGQGELYLVQRRKRKKHEGAQRDADREAEVQSLRSRVTELERRLSQLEAENAQLRSRDYSLQLS